MRGQRGENDLTYMRALSDIHGALLMHPDVHDATGPLQISYRDILQTNGRLWGEQVNSVGALREKPAFYVCSTAH